MEYFYTLIVVHKYLILLPIAIIEGPMITIIAGFLASLGILDFFIVYAIAVFGNLIGDNIYYWIGRLGEQEFISRYGRYVGVTKEKIEYAKKHGIVE
jgi:membrane protein DedA with SNARE-associated domain